MNLAKILALTAILAAAVAFPASAGISPAKSTFRSFKCNARVNRYDATSWACATMTVTPWQIAPDGTTTVTYTFRAKKKLKHVLLCVTKMVPLDKTNGPCSAYRRKIGVIPRGHIIKSVITLTAPPSDTAMSPYPFYNTTRFYKPMKWTDTHTPYWDARGSSVCIVPVGATGTCQESVGR